MIFLQWTHVTTRGGNQAQVPLRTQRLVLTPRQRHMLASTNRGSNRPTSVVLSEAKKQMHRENKQRRQALRAEQTLISPWTQYQGLVDTITPTDHTACPPHRNSMCPNGLALQHPAAELLKDWATFGCPTHTGTPWSKEEMWEAVTRGPHSSA